MIDQQKYMETLEALRDIRHALAEDGVVNTINLTPEETVDAVVRLIEAANRMRNQISRVCQLIAALSLEETD